MEQNFEVRTFGKKRPCASLGVEERRGKKEMAFHHLKKEVKVHRSLANSRIALIFRLTENAFLCNVDHFALSSHNTLSTIFASTFF